MPAKIKFIYEYVNDRYPQVEPKKVEITLPDAEGLTIDDVAEEFQSFLMAVGYHPSSVAVRLGDPELSELDAVSTDPPSWYQDNDVGLWSHETKESYKRGVGDSKDLTEDVEFDFGVALKSEVHPGSEDPLPYDYEPYLNPDSLETVEWDDGNETVDLGGS